MAKRSKALGKRPAKDARNQAGSLILRFSTDHLWVRADGDRAQVGLSNRGQAKLGEIIASELPETGEQIEQGEQFGELESTRTVHELIAPISGRITAVNADIEASPALVNEDPYHEGWLIEVELSDEDELEELMGAEEYEEFREQEGEED